MDQYTESNRLLWNDMAALHERSPSRYYDLAGFRAGASTLKSIERAELGDVAGKSLLHLMCHFGMDTLSWARLGARVTGADFSDRAIALAQRLAGEVGLDARFICSDVYDLPRALDDTFDIVFTSYGVLSWLPDIQPWARTVALFLKPGGIFYIVEHHPFPNVFDPSAEQLQVGYPYFHGPEPLRLEIQGSYADPAAEIHGVEYLWDHSLSEIINALIGAELRIEYLHEFPQSDYQRFSFLEEGPDGWWRWKAHPNAIPLLFSLKATK